MEKLILNIAILIGNLMKSKKKEPTKNDEKLPATS